MKEKVRRNKPPLLMLDSGAHSLYAKHVESVRRKLNLFKNDYSYYESKEFWQYVESYAKFLLENQSNVDYYVNIDVIKNPELSWKVLKRLESYGLHPIPVIHHNTPMKWLDKHLKAGYNYIGIEGLGQDTYLSNYTLWADEVFSRICPRPKYLPVVKTHGFAMTSYKLLVRYPWYSVDSASWAKSAAFGSIYIPHRHKGIFHFNTNPYVVCFSHRSPSAKKRGKVIGQHYQTLPSDVQQVARDWLEFIDIPLGRMDKHGNILEEGVINHYGSRGIANMRFFDLMRKSLPEWPWSFNPDRLGIQGFGI